MLEAGSVGSVTEQQAYEVVRTYDEFELRRYASHLVAEVVVADMADLVTAVRAGPAGGVLEVVVSGGLAREVRAGLCPRDGGGCSACG